MALLNIWANNPEDVLSFNIEQIVSAAGDGKLKDGSACSQELRTYLSQVKSSKLAEYVEHCLTKPFDKSGLVLQDLVNELGKRLEFQVKNGYYQGSPNKVGYDGLWVAPEKHTILIEVKTTDAYQISLDKIAGYRNVLLADKIMSPPSSILIVVGRKGTGELEAQVRGSMHAWDIRLISTDALLQLVRLKETTDQEETGVRIREILIPKEYTKLDFLIETVFATAQDVESSVSMESQQTSEPPPKTAPSKTKSGWEFTETAALDKKRDEIIDSIGKQKKLNFIKKTRAMYWDSSHETRIVCTISKRYDRSDNQRYWYAYHPKWDQFLSEGKEGYFVLGCMDLDIAFAIPPKEIQQHLHALNTTTKDATNTMYWHIVIAEPSAGNYELVLPKEPANLKLNEFVAHLTKK